MSVISEHFAHELAAEKAMREAYLSAQTRTKLTNQIRAMRTQRNWSQGEFAKILKKPQSNVSRIENREYGHFTLKTLFELANVFDCGLVVEFVPYEEFLRRTEDLTSEKLEVRQFNREMLQPLTKDLIHQPTTDIAGEILTAGTYAEDFIQWLSLINNAGSAGLGYGFSLDNLCSAGLTLTTPTSPSGIFTLGSLQEHAELREENARLREENAQLRSEAAMSHMPLMEEQEPALSGTSVPPAHIVNAINVAALGWTGP